MYRYDDATDATLVEVGESLVKLPLHTNHYANVKAQFYCPEKSSPPPPSPPPRRPPRSSRGRVVSNEKSGTEAELISSSLEKDNLTSAQKTVPVLPSSPASSSSIGDDSDRKNNEDFAAKTGSSDDVEMMATSPSTTILPTTTLSTPPAKSTTDERDKKISLNGESDEEEDEEIPTEEMDVGEEAKRVAEDTAESGRKKAKVEAEWTQERLTKEWRRFNIGEEREAR